jgi:hypothetical protein
LTRVVGRDDGEATGQTLEVADTELLGSL